MTAAKRIAPRLVTAALLSALVWLAGLHGAEAGINEWTTNGPEGGDTWGILALAIDPQSPTTIYAGTNSGGVFKSTDAGLTWSAPNTGLNNLYVNALAINPQTPTIIYAGIGAGVFAIQQQNRPPLADDAGLDLIVEATDPDGALVTP